MRAAKIDSNQVEIIAHLRKNGCKVLHLHTLKNCCDALVGYGGKLFLVEIKDGKKPKSQRQLTEGEKKFFTEWEGYPLCIIESIEDCDKILCESIVFRTNNRVFPHIEYFVDWGKERFEKDELPTFENLNIPVEEGCQDQVRKAIEGNLILLTCRDCHLLPSMPNSTLCKECFGKLDEDF